MGRHSVCKTGFGITAQSFEPLAWPSSWAREDLGHDKSVIAARQAGGPPIKFQITAESSCVFGVGVIRTWRSAGIAVVRVAGTDYPIETHKDWDHTLQVFCWLTELPTGTHTIEVTANSSNKDKPFAVHLSGLFCSVGFAGVATRLKTGTCTD